MVLTIITSSMARPVVVGGMAGAGWFFLARWTSGGVPRQRTVDMVQNLRAKRGRNAPRRKDAHADMHRDKQD